MTRVETIGAATPWVRIYALCEYPGAPRYVGKTIQYLGARHLAHIRIAKRLALPRLPVHRWLRKQIAAKAWLEIKLLENVADDTDWREREAHWIKRLRAEGHNLLNLTEGGEGAHGRQMSDEHKAAIAAALRTGSHVACGVCGKEFWAKRNEIAKGHAKYCSKRCSNGRHKGPPLL